MIILVCSAALAASCNIISSFKHDDDVVARVGKYRLYRSELASYIPEGLSAEDSLSLASGFIHSWAKDKLYLEMALAQLDKKEMDVSRELEDYRESLLKYRYEQRYVNDRLDTLVTDDQIERYYNEHQEIFVLPRPIMKVRFVDVLKDAPGAGELLAKISSSKSEDLYVADSLARTAALRYIDGSDRWMDSAVLAREFGTEYSTLMSWIRGNSVTQESTERGDIKYMYICDIRRNGIAPIEYCTPLIRDNILSARKRDLLSGLERDLLENARGKKTLVIY